MQLYDHLLKRQALAVGATVYGHTAYSAWSNWDRA